MTSETSTTSAPKLGPCRNAARCGGKAPQIEVAFGGLGMIVGLCPACLAELDVEREERRERLSARALTRAGGTRRLLAWTLDSHPSPELARRARAWLDAYAAGARTNLWMAGPVGTGKTGLAWGIVRTRIEAFFAALDDDGLADPVDGPALLIVWRDLLGDLRAAFQSEQRASRGEGDADPSQLLERARTTPLLALDDLGAERPTPFALEALAGLVEYRWKWELPTVVTSNYATRDLAARLGTDEPIIGRRIVSRLLDGAVAFRFDGPSLRRAGTEGAPE